MAHFAELKTKPDPTGHTTDTHQVVERVVVVGNDCVPSDMHVDGETWCINFFKGGVWKQTSYNNNFRKQYAGKGYTYNTAKDKFLSPQPYASWLLDANDDWQSPVTYPTDITDKIISWNEENLKWTATDNSDPVNNFNWDASALAWVSA
jgi:hypothetical protein|tara:strand:- start:2085 stop:2531 length:447 start_codon:yes stop_codon:yes gene_type:complete